MTLHRCDTCPFESADPVAIAGHEDGPSSGRGWLGRSEHHRMNASTEPDPDTMDPAREPFAQLTPTPRTAAAALGTAAFDRLAELRADLLAALAADDAYEADEDSDPGDYRTRVARQRAADAYCRAVVAAASGPGFLSVTPLGRRSGLAAVESANWSALLAFANQHRRAVIAAARLTTDELATAAARFGIVADPDRLPLSAVASRNTHYRVSSSNMDGGPDARDRCDEVTARMHDAVTEWSEALRAAVELTNRMRDFRATHPDVRSVNGTEMYQAVGFRAWPGDVAADYDASAERFELGPSGRWSRDYLGGLPPVYRIGQAMLDHDA